MIIRSCLLHRGQAAREHKARPDPQYFDWMELQRLFVEDQNQIEINEIEVKSIEKLISLIQIKHLDKGDCTMDGTHHVLKIFAAESDIQLTWTDPVPELWEGIQELIDYFKLIYNKYANEKA